MLFLLFVYTVDTIEENVDRSNTNNVVILSVFFVDSIEGNIDRAHTNVESGNVQLQKASAYQVRLKVFLASSLFIYNYD